MKRVSFLAALMLLVSVLTARAEIIASGQLSGDQSWTLTDDGTFTVSGTGVVTDDLINVIDFDWDYSVRHIVFEEGITHIGGLSYKYAPKMVSTTIPSTMQEIEAFPYSQVSVVIVNAETPPDINIWNGTVHSDSW